MDNSTGSPILRAEDLSKLPPLESAYLTRRRAVAALLKEQCGSVPFHANRAAKRGDAYWEDLASSMPNHPGVDLPDV